jgi:hypothetical protein
MPFDHGKVSAAALAAREPSKRLMVPEVPAGSLFADRRDRPTPRDETIFQYLV